MTSGISIAEWLVTNGNIAFEIIGTLAFALSGLLEAARKKLDIVGMAMVTFLAAFGGGTLRDILLDRRPFFWVQNQFWIWVVLAMCLLALIFIRSRHLEPTERATAWPDAIGLGIFSAGGTSIALQAGAPAIVAVIMGIITAVFGGVLRDVVVNEIPRAFVDHQPYSILAFAGGWVVVGLHYVGTSSFIAVGLGALVITALRFAAMIFGWRLPTWRV
ncbi:trimeric intracellular cation channel family protein [Rhodoluna lacicola]|uniref:trimeric intracellular cation channel family protein n=1 Tax=Rhodoluna lacicola TaxID=529884 RepID=UPI00222FC1F5|nr:trimeric intracellular cation channel family protein [Rhodoluna lacicola]BDS50627.1 membrane protein [Rhodoluna lacicola]